MSNSNKNYGRVPLNWFQKLIIKIQDLWQI